MEEISKKKLSWARFYGRLYLENDTKARLKAALGEKKVQLFLHCKCLQESGNK